MAWAYASVDALKDRLADTGTGDDAIYKSVLEAVSKAVDNYTQRTFRTFLATRYYTPREAARLDLDVGILAVTTLKTDEDGDRTYEKTWTSSDYDLLPDNAAADQMPYLSIGLAPNGSLSFPVGLAKSVELAGKWGWYEDLVTFTATLNEALDTSETGVDVSAAAEFEAGMTILIDSEQMYIQSLSGTILTVDRGVNGTTAATHNTGATVKRYRYPGPVVEATLIQATRVFRRKEAPFGVVGGTDMQAARNIPVLDPDVKALLGSYVAWERSFA